MSPKMESLAHWVKASPDKNVLKQSVRDFLSRRTNKWQYQPNAYCSGEDDCELSV